MSQVTLILGDCLEEMKRLPANSVDSVITDPPYALTSRRDYQGAGFMGKAWDTGAVAFAPDVWREVLRVAKPGAFLLAFGGDRTHHRLMTAIEDAGWELRTCIYWLFGGGFPKSHSISKAIDKAKGAQREIVGRYLDPDGRSRQSQRGKPVLYGEYEGLSGDPPITAPATDLARQFDGYGTALKPAAEIIVVAMAPMPSTFAANAERYGVSGLWIDGSRIPLKEGDRKGERPEEPARPLRVKPLYDGGFTARIPADDTKGRWPANVILDELAAAELDEMSGELRESRGGYAGNRVGKNWGMKGDPNKTPLGYGDKGGASRYFYTAKASRRERGEGNHHPCVKPLSLLEYLCNLTRTPTGGVVLDPFMGSGSTGIACIRTNRDFIGIEVEPSYFEIATNRIEHEQARARQLELAVSPEARKRWDH